MFPVFNSNRDGKRLKKIKASVKLTYPHDCYGLLIVANLSKIDKIDSNI